MFLKVWILDRFEKLCWCPFVVWLLDIRTRMTCSFFSPNVGCGWAFRVVEVLENWRIGKVVC